MATTATLFSGENHFLGGLSNEQELAKVCPAEFKQDNPWSNYAMKLFDNGGNIGNWNDGNWKWKLSDDVERRRQSACFQALLETFDLSHEDKQAVAGWMLSEMLAEVPEYVGEKKR